MRRDSVDKMKTLDEVIAELEDDEMFADALHYLKEYKSDKDEIDSTRLAYLDILTDYVALKQYWAEQQANPALSWEELKTMEGKPIWVKECNGDTKGWLLILRTNYDVINCTTKHGNSFYLYKSSYSEKWQAYRKERNE